MERRLTTQRTFTRRRLLQTSLALPLLPALPACTAPLVPLTAASSAPDAEALLHVSAAAHGVDALSRINDVCVRYAGQWHALVDKVQPALVDAGHRGGSEERLLLREGLTAQEHTGPKGTKHVTRRTAAETQGDVHVWFNGEESNDADARAAAALVVDGYGLFLLGPMLLETRWTRERAMVLGTGGIERIRQGGHEHECDVLRVRMMPGLGFSETDQLALYIDREDHLMRRVRFSLNGLESTRGAIAEVDTFEHMSLNDVVWPTRFHEQLLRPLPLPVHDWRLEGLDVNRGVSGADLNGREFTGKAVAPAATLAK
jgi:hypothetical protein